MVYYGSRMVWSPGAPNVPLLRALWSLLDGTWGLLGDAGRQTGLGPLKTSIRD